MNIAIAYDTETTGLPLFSEPSEDPRQPHMVELAASLVDLDTHTVLSSMDVIIRPDGWVIPEEVAAIHGITTELALAVGVPEDLALGMFVKMWRRAAVRIAHNESFDARIIRIAQHRFNAPEAELEAWKTGKAQCTQVLSTPILNLPPTEKMRAAKRFHAKSANLGEAFEYFTGQKLDGAHRAGVDVTACIAVHMAITRGLREAAAA